MSQLPGSSNTEYIRDVNASPVFERRWTPPLKVFLSYTSELRDQPSGWSFVDAACEGVQLAHDAVVHMDDFGAADNSADFCTLQVARCDVYVGIIGLFLGTPVPERPDISYTELEFESATKCGVPRLLFLIGEDVAPRGRQPKGHADRQLRFRRRLRGSGLMVASVSSPHDLKLKLLVSLVDLHGR